MARLWAGNGQRGQESAECVEGTSGSLRVTLNAGWFPGSALNAPKSTTAKRSLLTESGVGQAGLSQDRGLASPDLFERRTEGRCVGFDRIDNSRVTGVGRGFVVCQGARDCGLRFA